MGKNQPELPALEHVSSITDADDFTFNCHPDICCFTDCCRQLELALTPYDVLRLKKGLGISSQQFVERYVIIEFDDNDQYPRLYLTMNDDGQASCPFVDDKGCHLYRDRPGACRTYPLGRGVQRTEQGIQEHYVVLNEPHCHGFKEGKTQNIATWQQDQEIEKYNTYNDLMLDILHHPFFLEGKRLSNKQADKFVLSLYNLDLFREKISSGALDSGGTVVVQDDPTMLLGAMDWFKKVLQDS